MGRLGIPSQIIGKRRKIRWTNAAEARKWAVIFICGSGPALSAWVPHPDRDPLEYRRRGRLDLWSGGPAAALSIW